MDDIKTPETPAAPAPIDAPDAALDASQVLDEEKALDAKINKVVAIRLRTERERLQRDYDKKLAEVTVALTTPKAPDAAPQDHVKSQHEAALAKIAQMEQERETERREAAAAEMKAALASTMSELGVVNARALTALLKEEGKVTRDAAGAIVFKGALKDMSLKEGLAEFLKSEDGKFYVAPSGASGSGGSSAKPDARPTKLTEEQAKAILRSNWS